MIRSNFSPRHGGSDLQSALRRVFRGAYAIVLTVAQACAVSEAYAEVWTPDRGDGTYMNPIIHADYSDPDVIRVGDDYWMVASSFTCFPGIPVLHSTDLVNWEIVNHVYDRLPMDKYDRPAHGEGSWAPAIRYHAGKYYVYFCTPDDGLFVATADDPRGRWDLTQVLEVAKWEDPCPFWDDDGKAYLIHSIHRGGPAVLHRMSDDGMRLLDNGKVVYHDETANPILEGLKMYKRDGWYYILAPAGGVETGWQTALRSPCIYGPYEARRVMEQGNTAINGPHQGGLVDADDGREWWFIHFQSKGNFGRVTHLQPAHWTDDGWISIGEDTDGDGTGNPVSSYRKPNAKHTGVKSPMVDDDFKEANLSLQWQWQSNPSDSWYSLTENPGNLRLFAVNCPSEHGNLYFAGNLCLQKLPAPRFAATTKLEARFSTVGERAGLITMGNEYSYIALTKEEGGNRVVLVSGCNSKYAVTPQELASEDVATDTVWLRMRLISDDECEYSFSLDGKEYRRLGDVCKVAPGTWIGAKTGIFASSPNVVESDGYADFDFFNVEAPETDI